jgi:myosin-light-chain kinase
MYMNSIEGGELFERVIDDDFVLTEKACTIFMRQICEGVEYIHSQNILHLDMKVIIMFINTKISISQLR